MTAGRASGTGVNVVRASGTQAIVLRNGRAGVGGPVTDVVITGGIVRHVVPAASGPAAVPGLTRAGAADLGAEVVDLKGATVLPGLWDSHVHSGQWALARRRIDVSEARSAREAADLAIAASSASTGGEFTVGYGFRDAPWPDVPHKDLLAGAGPVVLVSNDLHSAWLSPKALASTGLGDHPTGLLREQDCFRLLARLPSATREELDTWIADAMRAAAARGVVGILDFELADNVTDWTRRAQPDGLPVRVRCSVPRSRLEEAIERGLRTGDPVPVSGPGGAGPGGAGPGGAGPGGAGPGSASPGGASPGGPGLLEVGPVKLFADGSLNTRTAYCADPYPDTGEPGLLEIAPEELEHLMRRMAEHGLHPAVHAIGDLAGAVVLDAFEAVGCPGRIEHAQLVRAGDAGRFARPGLVTSVQPAHCPDDRDVADSHWAGRTDRAYPYRALLAAGATLEFGSDAPVAPLDPWDGIAAAVARSDDDRPAWHPEQALGVADALAASSQGRRAVRPGSAADLVIVAEDPARACPATLRGMPVLGTLLSGRWTHRDAALA